MKKALYVLFAAVVIVSASSCRKDFETVPSSGNLEFSKETVYLDTVFTNTSSSTYMLKVYNRSNKDINIPLIQLKKADSKYRIMVDGMTGIDTDNSGQGDGKRFENVELLAKDSLFVFIETTVNVAEANPTDFLYTDEIEFSSTNGLQKVNLVTLIQDAVFLYPEKYADGTKETVSLGVNEKGDEVVTVGFELNEADPLHGNELHFTNQKPYVIYGYAAIPSAKELVIDPGARVHFHANSGLIAQPGSSLKIATSGWLPPSDPDNPNQYDVIFEGDRLEPDFSDIPGQWGTVWLRQTSVSNIDHLILKNATVGLLVEEAAPLTINNSQIYNSSSVGILGRDATITGKNIVVNLAGEACVATVGGTYDFRHCTFNNNWSDPGQVCVLLSNYEKNADGSIDGHALDAAIFYNCIIFGNNNIELFLDHNNVAAFNTDFKNCLVKFNDSGTTVQNDMAYSFIRDQLFGNIKNQNPLFLNVNRNKLNIFEDSPAHLSPGPDVGVPNDILGIARTVFDLGAYVAVPN